MCQEYGQKSDKDDGFHGYGLGYVGTNKLFIFKSIAHITQDIFTLFIFSRFGFARIYFFVERKKGLSINEKLDEDKK